MRVYGSITTGTVKSDPWNGCDCMPKPVEVMVSLPISQLTTLLNASQQVPGIATQVQQMQIQLTALRKLYQELLDKVTELNRYV